MFSPRLLAVFRRLFTSFVLFVFERLLFVYGSLGLLTTTYRSPVVQSNKDE